MGKGKNFNTKARRKEGLIIAGREPFFSVLSHERKGDLEQQMDWQSEGKSGERHT